MNKIIRKLLPVLLTLLLAVAAGCSAKTGESQSNAAPSPSAAAATTAAGGSTVYPLTIENYTNNGEGTPWQAKKQTFSKAPSRVVANTQGAGELMVKLGLTDKVVGVAAIYGEGDPAVAQEFKKIPVISPKYASKELVVGASPDLVMGRADLFADADWGVGTVSGLNDLGIKTFLQSTSVKGATLNSLYKDIEQLGQIFNVQNRAAEYTAELKKRADALKAKSAGVKKTFAYVSDGGNGSIAIYSGNIDTFAGDVLSLVGLTNSYADVTGNISKEQLIATNPDVLLISKYTGGIDPEVSIKAFYADSTLQNINAIKNKAIYVIDFNQFWGYSYSILDGAEKLAADMAAAK
ncbi:corrinoid ABC transporter substrate-binding protein [compost metagenome]